MAMMCISYLLQEGPLSLIVKANELLHDHHLARLSVGHLITRTVRFHCNFSLFSYYLINILTFYHKSNSMPLYIYWIITKQS